MMPFYQGFRGIRIGLEVQFCNISPGLASRMPASSTSSSMMASIYFKRPQIPSPRSSCSAYSRTGNDWYRCGIGLANAWSLLFFIFISSSMGMYPKLYLAPLMGIGIGSIIPWEFLPNLKPCSNPFYNITVAIILYMTGIGGCGSKSSPEAFTSSTVS